jgi:hypothetical protein
MTDLIKQLSAPFPADRVSWRVGSTNKEKTKGLALAYIDARDVMNRLDEVVGATCWSDKYETHGETMICYLSLNVGGVWVSKGDGAGDTQVEAEKGRISDAFKRSAVKWGIGRYLYDLDSPWVDIEGYGNSYRINKEELPRLRAILEGKAYKAPAKKPNNSLMPQNMFDEYKAMIEGAASLNELLEVWKVVFHASAEYDSNSQAELTKIKDKRKAELERV